jgi:DNA-binding beta-propeller fold protein YncE
VLTSDIQPAGHGSGARQGVFGRLALVLLGALFVVLLLTSSAFAATPTFVTSFGDPNLIPERLAVNETTGDVYVLNTNTRTVDQFSASGALLKELSVPESELGLAPAFQQDHIAVDNSTSESDPDRGWVYVAGRKFRVTAFDASGELKWQHVYPGGTSLTGIAVDPAGGLWVSNGAPERLDPATGEPTEERISGVEVAGESLAFDLAGDLYAAATTPSTAVLKYASPITSSAPTSVGEKLDGLGNPVGLEANDLATESGSEDVWVLNGGFEGATGALRFSATGEALPSFNAAEEVHFKGIAVDAKRKLVYVTDSDGNVEVWTTEATDSLAVNITGTGTVACEQEGAGSFGACAGSYKEDEVVNLRATAAPGSVFAGWLGCKHLGTNTCQITFGESAQEVTAVFLAEGKEGKAGKEGTGGSSGPAGAGGPQGPTGPGGAPGGQGSAGAQGPVGPAGKVTCKVAPQKHGKVKVTCTVKASASAASVRWRLMRSGRTIRRGTTRGPVRLAGLRRGHYRLYLRGTAGFTPIVIA